MEKYLIVKAKGGLGNRMLAGICGLIYADLSGRTPLIDWREGNYAPVGVNSYPLLFRSPITDDPADLDDIQEPVAPGIWTGQLWAQPGDLIARMGEAAHSNPRVYRKLCVDLSRTDVPERIAVFWSYLPKFPRLKRALRRDPRFRERSETEFMTEYLARYFTPNARVSEAVEKIFAETPRPVIGVHVRYTDRKAPLEKIEAVLERILRKEPEAQVFLATDNSAVETRVRNQVSRIVTIPKWLPDDGERLHGNLAAPDMQREAENALIDMWALSRCDYLVHSSHSTFSNTACLIGGLQRHQVFDVDRFNIPIQLKRFAQGYI